MLHVPAESQHKLAEEFSNSNLVTLLSSSSFIFDFSAEGEISFVASVFLPVEDEKKLLFSL